MAAHAHTRAHAIQYCNNLCKLSYAPSGKHQKTLHGDRKATSVEKKPRLESLAIRNTQAVAKNDEMRSRLGR